MAESLTSLCAIALVLTVIDGHPTTTSLDIARHFGKRHTHIMETIRALLEQLPSEYQPNFRLIQIDVDLGMGRTRQDPAYRITRDGFTLLAMGFTGKKALQFKLAYIDAFNRMEAELARQASLPGNAAAQPSKPKAMLVNLDEPAIDVRELLLSGQGDPVPLPPEVSAAIDQQAWVMAGEAYELAREHLRRRVAYRYVSGSAGTVHTKGALAEVKAVTLSKALAHAHWSELRSMRSIAQSAIYVAERNLEHINAVLSGQPKPKDMLY